jgi:hypothetical protein
MRVEVTPQHIEGIPGVAQTITITITNTSDVIGGYVVRALGADPDWIELDGSTFSVFPESSTTIRARIRVPAGLSAGTRRIGFQVRELTPPESVAVEEIDIEIDAAPQMRLALDALTVTGGSTVTTALKAENTGNTVLTGRFTALDPEDKVAFTFVPERVKLAPGERLGADVRLKARRPWFGNPVLRPFEFGFEQSDAFAAWDEATGGNESVPPPPEFVTPPRAQGVFVQKPRLARIAMSLLTLALAVTVFAVVITVVLSRVVSQSAADRELALAVAEAQSSTAATGSSSITGKVTLLTSGAPVADVAVQLYAAADAATAVATTHTGDDGTYSMPNLAAGSYKVAFFGAGFAELWYPSGLTDADAVTLTLLAGKAQGGVDVQLGGLPASVAGTVLGDDVSGAIVQVTLPLGATTGTTATTTPSPDDPTGGAAVVRTVPVGADGTFAITQIPSPSVYDLVVSKAGYATQIQPLDLSGGESRTGIEIQLQKGNGLISGHIVGLAGPLGGATVTATSGTTVIRTISVTQGDVGAFTLRSLPSPATFTVVVTNPGFASSTSTLSLTNGQQLSGVSIVLGTSAGTLGGVATIVPGGAPATGVTVTVSNGALTVQTVTQSAQSNATAGAWTVSGLSIPSTYTVTFARPDLASQTLSVSLDGFGNVTSDSQGSASSASQVNVGLLSATATLTGSIFESSDLQQQSGCQSSVPSTSGLQGEATVTVTSGSRAYSTTSASAPVSSAGQYVLAGLIPGTYTVSVAKPGRAPTTVTVTLGAGGATTCDVAIATPASVSGNVLTMAANTTATSPLVGATIVIYKSALYPATQYASAATDSAGAFSFAAVDAPGSYVLEVRSANGVLASKTFQITASQALIIPTITVTQ